ITTKSSIELPAAGSRVAVPRTRCHTFGITSPDLVHVLVHVTGHLSGNTRHGLEFLSRGFEEALRRPEVTEEESLTRRTDSRQVVEHGARHRLVAAAAVELDRESVGFISCALEQLEAGRVVPHDDRHAAAGDEYLL